MSKIDYELINKFRELGLYQSKSAIAGYAEDNFGLKIQRNLSFDNMIIKLEEHVGVEKAPAFVLEEPKADVELDALTEKVETSERRIINIEVPEDSASELIDNTKIELMAKTVSKTNDRKAELMKLLPPDFKPCFTPMGNIESFYPMSYWINDWIQDTPDWQYHINEYERVQEHKFLYTLVYYIALYGKFTIRETRNGEHITLI